MWFLATKLNGTSTLFCSAAKAAVVQRAAEVRSRFLKRSSMRVSSEEPSYIHLAKPGVKLTSRFRPTCVDASVLESYAVRRRGPVRSDSRVAAAHAPSVARSHRGRPDALLFRRLYRAPALRAPIRPRPRNAGPTRWTRPSRARRTA